jgi:AraC-like DNA-binding protein
MYWAVHVASSWDPARLHFVWPDGCVSLSIQADTRDARIMGPRTTALQIHLMPGQRFWGIRFRPEVGPSVCGVKGPEMRDELRVARDYLGQRAADLTESLAGCRAVGDAAGAMDTWVANLPQPRIDEAARLAVGAIVDAAGQTDTGSLAALCNLSERQLQRRFSRAVGLSPKQFARIRRMRTVLARVLESPRGRWSAIAAEFHYTDQAHLIRDLSRLTGLTPVVIADRLARISHADVTP